MDRARRDHETEVRDLHAKIGGRFVALIVACSMLLLGSLVLPTLSLADVDLAIRPADLNIIGGDPGDELAHERVGDTR